MCKVRKQIERISFWGGKITGFFSVEVLLDLKTYLNFITYSYIIAA